MAKTAAARRAEFESACRKAKAQAKTVLEYLCAQIDEINDRISGGVVQSSSSGGSSVSFFAPGAAVGVSSDEERLQDLQTYKEIVQALSDAGASEEDIPRLAVLDERMQGVTSFRTDFSQYPPCRAY